MDTKTTNVNSSKSLEITRIMSEEKEQEIHSDSKKTTP